MWILLYSDVKSIAFQLIYEIYFINLYTIPPMLLLFSYSDVVIILEIWLPYNYYCYCWYSYDEYETLQSDLWWHKMEMWYDQYLLKILLLIFIIPIAFGLALAAFYCCCCLHRLICADHLMYYTYDSLHIRESVTVISSTNFCL